MDDISIVRSFGASVRLVPLVRRCFRRLGFAAVIAMVLCVARAQDHYSDPLFPSVVDEASAAPHVPFFEISKRLEEVEKQIEKETDSLDALAPLQPAKQLDEFGYHSDYLPAVEGVPEEPLWTLDFDFGIRNRRILGVVLVPAIDERSAELKGYAFPRRFRIWSINGRGERLEMQVDWTTRDFPDPGMRPVLFRFPSEFGMNPETISRKGYRLEVFAGHEDNGLEFFSLARAHLIRTGELHWPRRVVVSSSFESAPYWSSKYLSSSRHTLGMPLSAKDGSGGDLVWKLPASKLSQSMVIRVELEEGDQLGWVNLFPGQNPDGIDVPGYGFPKTIQISRLVKKIGKNSYRRFPLEGLPIPANPGDNMVRLTDLGRTAGALEIACNDFPVYQGQAVFALGEIEILMRGRSLSRGRAVTMWSADFEDHPDLGVLVDGRVDGRNVLTLIDWIDQLAAGKPLEARLAMLETERVLLGERWQHVRQRVVIGLIILTLVGILTFVFLMLRGRKKAEMRLRRQIHSDLHDEVGSNLGSISIMAGQLEGLTKDVRTKAGLMDLALIAREACASLQEVVWVVDERKIRLPMLVHKLSERAERVLGAAEFSVELPADCPDEVVSLTFKRHLIMFFKEAVHNCARHALADQVKLVVSVEQRKLKVSLSDNGFGFDSSAPSAGWGLDSMKQRAEEMGGEMELASRPGGGTTIILEVPLAALSKEPNKAYKTSN